MGQVRIVTDSAAELSPEVVEELNITVIPWRLRQGSSTILDEAKLLSPTFYREAVRQRDLPIPIPPSMQDVVNVYAQLALETDEIVSIHASSGLVNIASVAGRARANFVGRCHIHVVDCQYISRAQGILVERAARAAQAGASAAEIVRLVHGLIPATYFAFHVDQLDYMVRRGLLREDQSMGVGLARALFMIEDGEITSFRRSRRRGTAVERLGEFVSEFERIEILSLLHTGLVPAIKDLKSLLAETLPEQGYEEHIYGPVLSSCIGPLALGVVVFQP